MVGKPDVAGWVDFGPVDEGTEVKEALSSLFSSSCTITALAGMGGIPGMERPGGGRAGDADVAVAGGCEETDGRDGSGLGAGAEMSAAPKDPNPKSILSAPPSSQ